MRKNNIIEKNKIIKLKNNLGEFEAPIRIIIEEQKRDFKATVSLRLGGEEYVGIGESYYLDDAFADLQRKLPEGGGIYQMLRCLSVRKSLPIRKRDRYCSLHLSQKDRGQAGARGSHK